SSSFSIRTLFYAPCYLGFFLWRLDEVRSDPVGESGSLSLDELLFFDVLLFDPFFFFCCVFFLSFSILSLFNFLNFSFRNGVRSTSGNASRMSAV
ncbi:hypothetical protein PFISCL1PPCAC_9449, partial [Pristionchus fissidentatus]